MDILRRIGLALCIFLFSLGIGIIVTLACLFFIIDSPKPLKEALSSSGVYETAIQDVLVQPTLHTSSLPMNDSGVRAALTAALPPSFAQHASEAVIDGIYPWIHGTTASPEFSVDLSPVKANFANNLALHVEQNVSGLPRCMQLAPSPMSTEEVLALTCMPRGVMPAQIADRVRMEVLAHPLLAEGDNINANTLKDTSGRPLTDQLAFLPQLYQYYTLALFAVPVIILLSSIAIIFWSTTKRAGAKRIAWLLISAGATALIIAAINVWFLQTVMVLLNDSTAGSLQATLPKVLETLARDIRPWLIGMGAGYMLVGLIMLVMLRLHPTKSSLAMGDKSNLN